MKTIARESGLLKELKAERLYSSTIQSIARHFWSASEELRVLDLADALQEQPEIAVVTIVNREDQVLGILRRDHLFNLVGKPFGRDVLMRYCVLELCEKAQCLSCHSDIFAVAQEIRRENPDEEQDVTERFHPLIDQDGRFQGTVSALDLNNHLSRITQDDIALAGHLQERLLAGNDLSPRPGRKLTAWSRAAKGVGGDFYFVRHLGEKKTFATLCDVSGKGVAASLIVSMVWGLLRMWDFKRGLKELLIQLNQLIVSTFQLEKYLTGFFMTYDAESRRLICADMGHSHLLLVRDGKPHMVRGTRMSLPIGIEDTIVPAINSFRMRSGDALFVYSDGITEQENREGVEFGERRLCRAVAEGLLKNRSLEEAIPEAIDQYRNGIPQQDDMSFLLLEVE